MAFSNKRRTRKKEKRNVKKIKEKETKNIKKKKMSIFERYNILPPIYNKYREFEAITYIPHPIYFQYDNKNDIKFNSNPPIKNKEKKVILI